MKTTSWPKDSKAYAERAFKAKEALHRRRERMSFAKKLEALDRLLEWGRQIRVGTQRWHKDIP